MENALKTCANLFDRFYDDAGRRLLAEEKMKTSWGKLPIFKRVELLTEMAGFALDHVDQAKALELVNEAHIFMDGAQWRPEHGPRPNRDLLAPPPRNVLDWLKEWPAWVAPASLAAAAAVALGAFIGWPRAAAP